VQIIRFEVLHCKTSAKALVTASSMPHYGRWNNTNRQEASMTNTVIIFGIIYAFHFFNKRDKELLEHMEKQIEIEAVREDYRNRDPDEFLEISDVCRAADGGAFSYSHYDVK
jgi:hypothetical protein